MNRATRREIEDLLTRGEMPEAPEERLLGIVEAIPPGEELASAASAAGPTHVGRHDRWRAIAAVLVMTVGAGFLILETQRPAARESGREASAPAGDATPPPQSTSHQPGPLPSLPPSRETPPSQAEPPAGETGESPDHPAPAKRPDPVRSPVRPAAAMAEASGDPLLDDPGRVAAKEIAPGEGAERYPVHQPGLEATAAFSQAEGVVAPLGLADRRPVGPPEIGYPAPPPSTGGTAEPNDQPYGDVFFEHTGVNPFVDVEDDPLSTFGLEVDTGSYTIVRRYVDDGHLPPPAAVRVEELLNSFDYRDPAPQRGDFSLRAEGAPTPFGPGDRSRLLRFAVSARRVADEDRPPALLIFVVDVSGSMGRENRLGLVRDSLALLLGRLRPDDRVGLVVYGSRGEVLQRPTNDHRALEQAIGQLRPGGSTNAEEGLRLAYELARESTGEESIRRIILCSDGVANVGRTGPDSILEEVGRAADEGIELTTVGFGMGNYNDVLMEGLADRGDGRYHYVDTLREARRIFVENLTGTLQTIATDAKAQVELDPRVVQSYRLLGYENRDIADERFRDDTVDAGEIGAGHTVTALYEVKLRSDAPTRGTLATLRLRYRSVAESRVVEQSRELRVEDLAPSWEAASPALRLASVVAELAEILKKTYWARDADPAGLVARAQRVSAEFPGDLAVAELPGLVGRVEQLLAIQRPATPSDDR